MTAATVLIGLLLIAPDSSAVDVDVRPADDAFDAILRNSQGGSAIKGRGTSTPGSAGSAGTAGTAESTESTESAGSGGSGGGSSVRIEFRTPCEMISDRASGCVNTGSGCPEGQTEYRQWSVSAGAEVPLGLVCSGPEAPAVASAAPPQVTGAMVLEAFRQIPVPQLRSVSQPDEKTLVNFETILHTEAESLSRTVTILGQSVRLEISPSSFRWEHGDGTSTTTTVPGAPYPHKDVVHRYLDAGVTVHHRVVVTWSAQWSLNGGPLQPVSGTVTTTGPTTALRVAEAVPALSGQRGTNRG